MYDILFRPTAIGKLQLKNRIVMGPMGNLADPDGGFSERQIAYYAARAKGGTGLIVSGSLAFNPALGAPYSGSLTDIKHVGRLQKLTEEVHRYGAKFAVQLNMGGGRCGGNLSASEVPTVANPAVLTRAMTLDEIHGTVAAMGKAAAFAKNAEVDAIVIHAYAGYLLDQFQSAEWNHRTDEYGGSLENRMRLTCELIEAVKKANGKDFPVIVKLSVMHNTENGRKLDEGLEMCRIVEAAGADAIIVDAGSFETQWDRCIPTVYASDAYALDAAKAVKAAVSIPVLGQNNLDRPEAAKAALEDGCCDLVLLGHGLLADPDWANKVRAGKAEDIRACIGCNNCLLSVNTAKFFRCSVNPWLLNENDPAYQIKKTDAPKKILVIGGGPAGMSAAITAARAGHDVALWEQGATLGGNASAAARPLEKDKIARYIAYLAHTIEQCGVTVTLGKTADADSVAAGGYDLVVLAAGASAKRIPLAGAESANVVLSTDVLAGKAEIGGHVVVLGGGLIGCEIACEAAKTAKSVTIVEALPGILMTAAEARNNAVALHRIVKESGVSVYTDAKAKAITAEGLVIEQGGEEKTLPCDTLIVAVGLVPNNALADELTARGIKVVTAGDAKAPRKILQAVREGFFAVLDNA